MKFLSGSKWAANVDQIFAKRKPLTAIKIKQISLSFRHARHMLHSCPGGCSPAAQSANRSLKE